MNYFWGERCGLMDRRKKKEKAERKLDFLASHQLSLSQNRMRTTPPPRVNCNILAFRP